MSVKIVEEYLYIIFKAKQIVRCVSLKFKIFVTARSYGVNSPEVFERLKKIGEVVRAQNPPLKAELLSQIIHEYDAIVAGLDEYTAPVLEKAEKLKILARHGVGVDNVDMKKATELGIIVTYTPSANAISVAEHTFALILSLVKKIVQLDESVKTGEWARAKELGSELHGKFLGIIGLGKIGSTVAQLAKAFGMTVIVYDPYVKEEYAERLGVKLLTLENLLQISDIVSIHAPYTNETHHIIGARELSMMKKEAYIINTARGGLIDEKALIAALRNKVIAGAALDVFENEPPPPNYELLKMDNVIVTPHSAAHTRESVSRMTEMVTVDIEAVLRGERPKYVANPEVLSRDSLRVKLL